MLISLDDFIWPRLYGPYGHEDVAGALSQLARVWDGDVAQDLFWEKLHHQDTLYPATYAALPWLWKFDQEQHTKGAETLEFLSHVLACAVAQHGGVSATYNGLSLDFRDHHHDWIDDDKYLTPQDMEILGAACAMVHRNRPANCRNLFGSRGGP